MKKIFILLTVFLILCTFAITLEEYLDLALTSSHEYIKLQNEFQRKTLNFTIARGRFLPQIAFALKAPDYTWREELMNFPGFPERISIISESNNIGGNISLSQLLPFSGRLQISNNLNRYSTSYNLYDGVNEFFLHTNIGIILPILEENPYTAEYRRRKNEYDIAKNDMEKEMRKIKKTATDIFINNLLYEERSKIVKEDLEAAKRLHELTLEKFASGLASQLDLIDIEVQINQKEIEKIDIENKKREYNKRLNDMVNRKGLSASGNIDVDYQTIDEFDVFYKKAMSNDTSIVNYDIQIKEAKRNLKYSNFRKYFTSSVNFGYNLSGRGEKLENSIDDYKKSNWFIYLSLSVPIFDASIKKAEHDLNILSLESLDIAKSEYEKELDSALRDLYDALIIQRRNVELYKIQAEKSKKLVELADLRYENGLESLERVKAIHISFEKAKYDLHNAIFQYNRLYYDYLYHSE